MAREKRAAKERTASLIEVDRRGWLRVGSQSYRCALGRNGVKRDKREGDGATPAGIFALRRVLYRADRMPTPRTLLTVDAIEENDGWCDAPEDAAYNKAIKLPYAAHHERLWRMDALYDLIVVIGHNDSPPQPHAGSAIFAHVAAADYGPTEGCITLSRADLEHVLARCGPGTLIAIGAD